MNHASEFSEPKQSGPTQAEKELAATYARLFLGSDDGKRVLADLRGKFGVERLVFLRNDRGQVDVNGGLLREGERHVMKEIEEAIKAGTPGTAPLKK